MSAVIFLILSFFLLYFGGEILVRASVSLALKMRISTMVVGLTVVAFATSAPELFVTLKAVIAESDNIALGNIIGSNIANIALVLGLTAIIFRVKISEKTLSTSYPVMLAVLFLLVLVLYYFDGIPFYVGYLFVSLLVVFIWKLIVKSRNEYISTNNNYDVIKNKNSDSFFKNFLLLLCSVFLLKYGAEFLVESTKSIAKSLGVSDKVIAVTIVSIGTSVPELVASIVAALKKEENLAVGSLIGSNIFNVLAVLGITASFKEINLDDFSFFSFDFIIMLIVSITLGIFIYVFSKKEISRKEGFIFVCIYVYYIYETIY